METALNIVWDAVMQPGDRVTVFGAGVVGLAVAFLASRIIGSEVVIAALADGSRVLTEDVRAVLYRREKAALAITRRIIATSARTAEALTQHYDVPHERITVAIPGTDPAPRSTAANNPPVILSIGSLIPRKGLMS